MSEEIKRLIEDQGRAFEAFKAEVEAKKAEDPVAREKLGKIEAALDKAVEAKAALEAGLEAERKEREELEAKINRLGVRPSGEAEAKAEAERKEFNLILSGVARERQIEFSELDQAGLDSYKAANVKQMRRGESALSRDEAKTLSVGSDTDGGYFVTPDVSGRIVRRIYETSPIRQIASVQTISTDKLEGVEDLDEAGAGYADERNLSGDEKTPQTGKWSLPVFWIDTEPKATQQMLDDSAFNVEGWLGEKVADKFARFENREFVVGAGNRIRGLTSYPTADDTGAGVPWGSFGRVNSGANGGFAAAGPADVLFDLIGALKSHYLGNSKFLTRRSVITAIRKFKDTTGQYLWQPSLVAGQPESLAGYPIVRAEDLPALAAGSLSMAFGDFAAAYQIVDRQGMKTLRDALTAKPLVKFYTTKRVGGGAVNFEAIKFLRFAA